MRKLTFLLLFIPMMAMAQKQMSADKVKNAGVIVLYDKYVDPLCKEGNMIILRLKDKSRPSGSRNKSVYVHEICNETKVQEKYEIPIIKDELEISNEEISMIHLSGHSFILSNDSQGLVYQALEMDKVEAQRKYKIVKALFFKNYADFIIGSNSNYLGEENDEAKAFGYISKMFKDYK